jgi:hypothetical protein
MRSSTVKFTFLFITIISLSLFLSHCKEDDSLLHPVIVSFTPSTGVGGTTVTVTGKNFSTTDNANTVKFNGTDAVVSSETATEIVTTVPTGATTGKITVTVNGLTATSETDFVVSAVIASFSPTTGIVGTTVTITGSNFSTNLAGNVVKFSGINATVTAAISTQLTVTVPSGATTGKISVATNGVAATSTSDFIVPLPTIASFSPAYALPGEMITITGTNFVAGSLTLNKVKVNNVDATVTSATGVQLVAIVPATASTGKITVDVDGQTVTSASDFDVIMDIPRNGLVAFYPFNGNANDVSGNNLNGTLSKSSIVNSAFPVPGTDRFGNADRSYSFNGTSSYITMGNPLLLKITNQITISAWVKTDNVLSAQTKAIITKVFFDPTAGNNPKGGYKIEHKGHLVSFSLGVGVVFGNDLYYSELIASNTWVLITMVIDGTSYKLYKDGQLATQMTGSINLTETRGDLTIGSYRDGFIFNGFIDDIAIYNRPLSATEVTQLYNQTISKH